MQIFPAIDLKDGRCVRLAQGDFNAATVYRHDPATQARLFAEAGAVWLHVVDLDGAKAGAARQTGLIADIAKGTSLKVQAGGGIRDEETIDRLLNAGVARVVIGSLAVSDPARVKQWLKKFGPESVVLALDVRLTDDGPELLAHGWQSGSRCFLWDLLGVYGADTGLRHVLCTDVSRDGMLGGSNVELYQMLRARRPDLNLLASGGVGGMTDLDALYEAGVSGVIVGKALYEGRVDLRAAVARFADAG